MATTRKTLDIYYLNGQKKDNIWTLHSPDYLCGGAVRSV